MKDSIIIAYVVLFITKVYSWDIRIQNSNDVARLRHVSLFYLRAFLCIELTTPENSNSIPTLMESTWPENILAVRPKIFPSPNAHVGNDKRDCEKIHRVRSTDVDGKGYLWILDAGNVYCPPKIIIYDLQNKNIEITRSCLLGYANDLELVSIKINPDTTDTVDHMAYITVGHGKFLITFFLHTRKWGEIHFKTGTNCHADEIHPIEIAFTIDQRFYIANGAGDLFLTDSLSAVNSTEVQANHLGSLLDKPRGLITDEKGFLYYILPRFGAVVRWDPTRTLNAEGHDILNFQTEKIIQILFGIKGSVWIAMENMLPFKDHCIRLMYHYSSNFQL